MKALKKVIAVSFAAAALLGIAASASAKMPTAPGTVTVMLYKEKESCPDNRWVADTATTFIPLKNLRWDAKIVDISSNNKKTSIDCRAVGAFELNICKGTYAKPGDRSKIRFVVKQKDGDDWEYKSFRVNVRYMAAINPLTTFTITGTHNKYDVDNPAHTRDFTLNFVNKFANDGNTVKTYEYTLPAGITTGVLGVGINGTFYAGENIYGTLKSGKEIRLYNGSMYDFSKFCSIKINYKTTINLWKEYSKQFNDGWTFYKKPNDSFKGTKRFDNMKSLVLYLK
jgi:hypothetical protein